VRTRIAEGLTGSVTWRAVPAMAGGFLVTLVSAVLVLCLGRRRRDAVSADRLLRWWAGGCLRAAGARVRVTAGPGSAVLGPVGLDAVGLDAVGLDAVGLDAVGLDAVGLGPVGLGPVELDAVGPCVVVANHQSGLDPVTLVKALPLSLRILAMRELFEIVLLGRALRTIGMIEVDRESPSLRVIVKSVAELLAAGHSVLIFPEGKISVDGSVREFKDGAFLMAVMNQVPILPVAICGTNKVWPAAGREIRSGTVHIAIGPPIATSGRTRRDVPALRAQAREFIATAHDACPVHTSGHPRCPGSTRTG
jgi:1-acyl-sn-glycerol-3-phosphate acyltransferase